MEKDRTNLLKKANEKNIEIKYIEQAEKWFIENLGESRKKYDLYDSVILDIAEDIKNNKELDPVIYFYDLFDVDP